MWRILNATRHLASPIGVDEILQKTIDSALQVFDADRGSVFLFDAKTNELYIRVATSSTEAAEADDTRDAPVRTHEPVLEQVVRFSADRGIAGETARQRRLINVPDCYADPRFNREVDRQTGYRTRCLLSVPLLGIDETLVGVLQILNRRSGAFNEDDEKIATILAAHCAVALQRAMLLEEYVLKQKMQRDLALAREIQISALPRTMPVLAGYQLAAWSEPADETGGDIYDAVALGERRVALLMADATGHGIGPALSVSQFRAMFRLGLLLGTNIGELLSSINLRLEADLPPGRFITAFAGILDSSENVIQYHSGGQAPLLHYHAGQDRLEWLDASAPPLGILAGTPLIAPPPVIMESGDIFALISDGFFECANQEGEEFGSQRVGELIRRHCRERLEELRQKLCDAVRAFAGDGPRGDDMTMVLVRRNAVSDAIPASGGEQPGCG